ncbi:MAG TPA: metal-dependent hydrolase [Gemmatimonadales bacterium]|nr:metal-dependent hydrolase [Gemmatimonadales bacterium]
MDNLAHALVGAAIGRAIGGRRIPAAGWIGAIAANAPDWTELFIGLRPGRGSPAYYVLHRGITHSLVGAVVEAVALGLVFGFSTRRWCRRQGMPLPAWSAVGVTVTLAVLSHLYMDWQGSYGLRPFLPWSGRWYYADWVAIVDPFFWLVPLVALAWGERRYWRDAIPYLLILALISWPILTNAAVAPWVPWLAGLLIVVGMVGWIGHWFGAGVTERSRAAAFGLAVVAVYAAAQALVSIPEKAGIQRAAVARFGASAQWAALTVIGHPFQWEPVLASSDSVAGPDWTVARNLQDPRVQRALHDTPEGRAMGQFARFLAADVASGPRGPLVLLRDARYAPVAHLGWGVVAAPLPSRE